MVAKAKRSRTNGSVKQGVLMSYLDFVSDRFYLLITQEFNKIFCRLGRIKLSEHRSHGMMKVRGWKIRHIGKLWNCGMRKE